MEFHPHSVLMDSDMEGPGRRVHLQAFQRPQGEERGGEHIELSDAQIAILPHSVVIGCQGDRVFSPHVSKLCHSSIKSTCAFVSSLRPSSLSRHTVSFSLQGEQRMKPVHELSTARL